MSDIRLDLRIDANGRAAVREIRRVDGAVDKLGGQSRKAGREMQGFERRLGGVTGALRGMLPALSAGAVLAFSREIARAGDELDALRLGAEKVSGSTRGFEQLYASAQQLGVSLNDAASAANNFATPLAKLGRGYQQTLRFSENLTKSLRLYGVRGQAAVSITTQLAQALNSGQLAGDELKSLTENAGPLAGLFERAIQQILGTQESLKDLGSQGRLTADVVVRAWDSVFGDLEADFEDLPRTLAQQEAAMGNAANRLFAALDGALKSSEAWQWLTGGITRALDNAARLLEGEQNIGSGLRPQFAADDVSRFNFLIGRERELASAYAEQVAELERLAGSERVRQSVLAQQQQQVREAAQAWGDARAEIAAIQQANKEAAISSGEAAAAANEQAKAMEGVAKAARDTSATISGLTFNSDKALEGWSKTEAQLRGEVRQLARDMERDGIKVVITSTFRSGSGGSQHNYGRAVDLWFDNFEEAKRWWQANSDKYEIRFPVADENPLNYAGTTYGTGPHWHVQLAEGAKKAQRAIDGLARTRKQDTAAARAQREADQAAARAMGEATSAVEGLIRQYLPAEAAARELEQAQLALALAGERAGLSQVQQEQILRALEEDLRSLTDTTDDELDRQRDLWAELGEGINDSMRETFADLVADGRASLDDLGDYMLRWLARMAYDLATNPLRVAVGASGGGTQLFGGGGITGDPKTSVFGGGGIGGIGQLFTGSSIGAGVANTAARFGVGTGGGFFTRAGTNLISTPNWAFGVGGIGGGLIGNALFDGGYSGIGSSGGSALGSIAGGALLGGPIGAIAGGLLGGAGGGFLGSLFGGEDRSPQFQGSVYGGRFTAFDDGGAGLYRLADEINQSLDALEAELGDAAAQARDAFTEVGGISESPDAAAQQLQAAAQAITEDMIDAFRATAMDGAGSTALADLMSEAFAQAGDDPQSLQAAVGAARALYAQVQQAAEALGVSEQDALGLVEMAGGYQQLTAARERYLSIVQSEQEQLDALGDTLTRSLGAVGLELPQTRDELEALVDALDLTSDSGRRAYTAVMGVIDGLGEFVSASERAAAQLREQIASASQSVRDTLSPSTAASRRAGAAQRILEGTELGIDGFSSRAEFDRYAQRTFGGTDALVAQMARNGRDVAAFARDLDTFFSATDQMREAQAQAARTTSSAADAGRDFASSVRDAADALGDWVERELRTASPGVSGIATLRASEQQYQAALAAATAGDADAMGRLTQIADAYLSAQLAQAMDPTQYAIGRGRVLAEVGQVATLHGAAPAGDDLRQEIRELKQEISELRAVQTAAAQRQTKYQRRLTDIYEDWDANGLPAERAS